MVKMGAREFVYPSFGYRSRWLRNRDPVYGKDRTPKKSTQYLSFCRFRQMANVGGKGLFSRSFSTGVTN